MPCAPSVGAGLIDNAAASSVGDVIVLVPYGSTANDELDSLALLMFQLGALSEMHNGRRYPLDWGSRCGYMNRRESEVARW